MASITCIASNDGLEVLNSELRNKVTSFALIGSSGFANTTIDALVQNQNSTYGELTPHIFAELDITTVVFDETGVLTFHLAIPYDIDYGKYIYGIALLYVNGATKKVVSIAKTPKVAKISGVGGSFTFKVAVLGSAGEVVFKIHDFVTVSELEYSIDFQNLSILANARAITELTNKLIEKGILDV